MEYNSGAFSSLQVWGRIDLRMLNGGSHCNDKFKCTPFSVAHVYYLLFYPASKLVGSITLAPLGQVVTSGPQTTPQVQGPAPASAMATRWVDSFFLGEFLIGKVHELDRQSCLVTVAFK